MASTGIAVRQAKPSGKSYTLRDFDGLVLYVSLKGTKQWRLRFYWMRKQARISLGAYPAVILKQARVARDATNPRLSRGAATRPRRARLIVVPRSRRGAAGRGGPSRGGERDGALCGGSREGV
jgi:hypothetical protein